MRAAALSAAASLIGLALVIVAALGPRDPSSAAAVFPPWWSQSRIFSAAASAGDVTARGGLPNVVLVRGDPATLSTRLRAAGALFLLDPLAAGVCGSPQGARS